MQTFKEAPSLAWWSDRCCRAQEAHLKLDWTIQPDSDTSVIFFQACMMQTPVIRPAAGDTFIHIGINHLIILIILQLKRPFSRHYTKFGCMIDWRVDSKRNLTWNLHTWQVDLYIVQLSYICHRGHWLVEESPAFLLQCPQKNALVLLIATLHVCHHHIMLWRTQLTQLRVFWWR